MLFILIASSNPLLNSGNITSISFKKSIIFIEVLLTPSNALNIKSIFSSKRIIESFNFIILSLFSLTLSPISFAVENIVLFTVSINFEVTSSIKLAFAAPAILTATGLDFV